MTLPAPQGLVAALALVAALGCPADKLENPPREPPPLTVSVHGVDRGEGNLLAVQAWMQPWDYASEEALFCRLDRLFAEAATRGFLGPRTVVVLPEYIGTWLVAEGESDATYRAATTSDAMTHVVLGRPFEWLGGLMFAPASDGVTYATFRAKGARMAEVYERVMSRLAREYGVTLVGGSIPLPEPTVQGGAIAVAEGGALYNASFVFDADGSVRGPVVRKAFPTESEQTFLQSGSAAELPVFDTPAGRLGVLVCADAWFPAAWSALFRGGAEIVAVPAFIAGAGVWDAPWGGYSGHPPPADVDLRDVGTLTEAEAWRKYTRCPAAFAPRARARG